MDLDYCEVATDCITVWWLLDALSAKDHKQLFPGFVETGMVEELGTLALYLRELQLREKYGGILDWKKMKKKLIQVNKIEFYRIE